MGDYPGVGVETGGALEVLSSNPLKRILGLPSNEHGTSKWTGVRPSWVQTGVYETTRTLRPGAA